MARVLFYLVILVAGGALAYLVAEAVMTLAGNQPGDVALEGSYALHHRPFSADQCDVGPQLFGLPLRELAVGTVTTLFGILMQSVGVRMIRRG